MKNIVETYTDAWWTRGNIDASITQMVADAEAKDAEAKRLAEEAAAAEAAAEEADDGEAEEDADSQEGEAREDENEETKQQSKYKVLVHQMFVVKASTLESHPQCVLINCVKSLVYTFRE